MGAIKKLIIVALSMLMPTTLMAQDESLHPQLSTYVYGGAVLGLPDNLALGLHLDVDVGCRLNDWLFLGGEIGVLLPEPITPIVDYFTPDKQFDPMCPMGEVVNRFDTYYHLASNVKLFLPRENKSVKPFLDFSVGGNINTSGCFGFYWSGGIGFDYNRFSAMLCYEGIATDEFAKPWRKRPIEDMIYINLGIRFGK